MSCFGPISRRFLLLAPALSLLGKDKKKQKQKLDAIIFGTVFRESGLSLPGANITAYNEASPKKKFKAVTNYRGEYRIHVPSGEANYVVIGNARKFEQAQRTVKIYDLEQATANLILKPKK
jgi:hypothetical protein